MENNLNYYLSLSEDYIKFDSVNQITNVFFDDSRNQIFIVKNVSISVKNVESKNSNFSFSLTNSNSNLIAIKFSSNNDVLAVQRSENALELIGFKNNQVVANQILFYATKHGKYEIN